MNNFKTINHVPGSTALIDIALNKTQRKTPTVIRTNHLPQIRSFYIKKIRFASQQFSDRLSTITEQFPRVEDVHPFYGDLMNVLYDRDHFKMALGHVNTIRGVVDRVSGEYTKLVKYADSLYRAKMLKRAALGRMATAVKGLTKSLEYLEEVRQHLSRLPTIDPTGLTLLVCGYPNVGKSSFVNCISRAMVDVQPYAFTTKNLYVGHFDHSYNMWQVIDTPGILDHPIEERNTIEMVTVTALAHIQSAVLFFMDISSQCSYSIHEQISLFKSIEPLFGNFLIVISKSDLLDLPGDFITNKIFEGDMGFLKNLNCLDMESCQLLTSFLAERKYLFISNENLINIDLVKKTACEMLINERLQKKLSDDKITEYMSRIKIIRPKNQMHDKKEPSHLRTDNIMTEREKFEEDRENYCFDEVDKYVCDNKYDVIPELYAGKNIADFIDPEILEKLKLIEENEIKVDYGKKFDIFTKDEREYREVIGIRKKQREIIKNEKGRCLIPPSWINNRKKVEDEPVEVVMRDMTGIVPYKIKKNEFRKIPNPRYFDPKPKHIFRSSSKRGERNR